MKKKRWIRHRKIHQSSLRVTEASEVPINSHILHFAWS